MRRTLAIVARRLWQGLRTLSGDDAYERYVEHVRCRHPGETPLDRRSFYLAEQARRWSGGPNRCC